MQVIRGILAVLGYITYAIIALPIMVLQGLLRLL